MKLVTSEQIKMLDKLSIEKIGIPGVVLMENAGKSVADFISERWSSPSYVYIFCGTGNNGGDGLVAARHLYNRGYKVKVFLAGPKEKIKGDAAVNLNIALNMGINIKQVLSLQDLPLSEEENSHKEKIILIDALLGTGARGAPKGIIEEIVNLINKWKGVKIAVDLPTGVNADTGEVAGKAVKADYTITFAYPKRGTYLYPGIDYVGEVKVIDIGIPFDILERENLTIKTSLLLGRDFSPEIFYRRPSSHKGEFGHLLVLAGSSGLTGAATLSCMAALKIGAGLITLGIPESLNPILEEKLTEVMTLPLPETKKGVLSIKSFDEIKNFSNKCSALVIGPGLSRDAEVQELVEELLKSLRLPVVLDADGINCLAGKIDLISRYQGPVILTPHPGELARLTGTSTAEIQKDRIKAAVELAQTTGKIAVLKGAGTVIADSKGTSWINTTGNPGMASGGSGDVLTGIIGGLLAQRKDPLTCAKLGVYLHGLAADLAIKKQDGIPLLTARDIVENLVLAIRSLNDEHC